MRAETWFSAEEAVDAGLADEVIVKTEKVTKNTFDLSVFSYAGREQAPAPVTEQVEAPDEDPYVGVDWSQFDALKGAFA